MWSVLINSKYKLLLSGYLTNSENFKEDNQSKVHNTKSWEYRLGVIVGFLDFKPNYSVFTIDSERMNIQFFQSANYDTSLEFKTNDKDIKALKPAILNVTSFLIDLKIPFCLQDSITWRENLRGAVYNGAKPHRLCESRV